MPVSNLLADIDIDGKESNPGVALEYFELDAIKNSLQLWLTSKKGDFLRNPSVGGVLDKYNFKNLDNSKLYLIKLDLITEFKKYFDQLLSIQDILFTLDNVLRILKIEIRYYDITYQKSNSVIAYVNSDFNYKRFEYSKVEYTGENLYNWCVLQLPSLNKAKLQLDSNSGYWTVSKYQLINFNFSDPYFNQILILING